MTKSTQPPASNQATLAGRTVRYIADLNGQGHGIAIRQNGKTTSYWLDVFPADFGWFACTLEKCDADSEEDNEQYDVLLDGKASSCTCADFTYRGWKKGPCKHMLACTALLSAGKIKPAVK